MDKRDIHRRIADIVESMESRNPEDVIAQSIMHHVVIPTLKEELSEIAEKLGHIYECVAQVSWAFEQLEQAKTLPEQSNAYDRLANAMSALESWHPDYDIETGEIPEQDDEVLDFLNDHGERG